MSVTEAQRHQLFEAAKAVFGEANAETFMNLQPTVDYSQLATKTDVGSLGLATKADIEALRLATKADIASTRADIETLRQATKADIETLRLATKADFAEVRADMADLKNDLLKTIGTWYLTGQGMMFAGIAALKLFS